MAVGCGSHAAWLRAALEPYWPGCSGWLVDFMGDPHTLRYAISIEAAVVGIPALILVSLGLKHYTRTVLPLSSPPAGFTEIQNLTL